MAVPAAREPEKGNVIVQTKDFIEESVAELKKVTWPDYAQLKNATIVVLVFVTSISLVIFTMDWIIRQLITLIMSVFGA
jgi:preprotein translocase SecE subunit